MVWDRPEWALDLGDGAGRTWIGTTSGLSIFDGETWTTYTTEDGLANNSVQALAEKHGKTPVQVAIAWVLSQGFWLGHRAG